MNYPPCSNPNCKSYGESHPNCRCHSGMAKGGEVKSFCAKDNKHEKGCEYFKSEKSSSLAFNLNGAKKVASDAKSSTFKLKNGHSLRVSHAGLDPAKRKAIAEMPLHKADGGDVADDAAPTETTPVAQPVVDPNAFPEANADPAQVNAGSLSIAPQESPTIQGVDSAPGTVGLPGADANGIAPDAAAAPAPASAPAPAGAASASKGSGASGLPDVTPQSMFNMANAGIQAEQKATQAAAEAQLKANQEIEASLAQHQLEFDQGTAAKNKEIAATLEDVKAGHINPNAYLESMTTPQKVSTAIGLFLGGWSSAYTHQGNPAAQFLEQQINRDVESQKANLDNKKTVLGAYYDQTRNMQAAEQMARATQMAIYAKKFEDASLTAATPLAAARAKQAAAALQQQIYPLVRSAQWAQTQQSLMQSGQSNADGQIQGALLQAKINGDNEGYKDIQSRYLPGIGLAKIPLTAENRTEAVNLQGLDQNVAKAIAIQNKFGNTGSWTPKGRADANSIKQELSVSLGQLYNLKRINDHEFKSYTNQIGNIGGVNAGGTIEGLKNLQDEIQSRKANVFGSLGLQAPPQAAAPSQYRPGDAVIINGRHGIVQPNGDIKAVK